jgi:hypothetical protein
VTDPTPTPEDEDRARDWWARSGLYDFTRPDDPAVVVARLIARVRAEEREACAAACDRVSGSARSALGTRNGQKPEFLHGSVHGAERCAGAIRARGAS